MSKIFLVADFGLSQLKVGLFSFNGNANSGKKKFLCSYSNLKKSFSLFSLTTSYEESCTAIEKLFFLYPNFTNEQKEFFKNFVNIAPKASSFFLTFLCALAELKKSQKKEFDKISSLTFLGCSPTLVAINKKGEILCDALFSCDFPVAKRGEKGYYNIFADLLKEKILSSNSAKKNIESENEIKYISLFDYFNFLLTSKISLSILSKKLRPFFLSNSKYFPKTKYFAMTLGYAKSPLAFLLFGLKKIKVVATATDYACDLLALNPFLSGNLVVRGGTFYGINLATKNKKMALAAKKIGFSLMPHPIVSSFNISKVFCACDKSEEDGLAELKENVCKLREIGFKLNSISCCGGSSEDSALNILRSRATSLPLEVTFALTSGLYGGLIVLLKNSGVIKCYKNFFAS